ncbi:Hypothetical protein SCF082_LOCUS52851 [Durusdinium trenchii]|uniref:Uncharacterized protein n=1 Tax=Durusdinium trenchii TaxID=1381693 RepID=A0ABP0SNT3_9DINO
MSGRSAQARPILVFYHIPGDGDEAEMPNAFPVLKPEGQVMLQDVRSKFPLPGTCARIRSDQADDSVTSVDLRLSLTPVPLGDSVPNRVRVQRRGRYHFRFKMRWGPDPLQVAWMDVTNEAGDGWNWPATPSGRPFPFPTGSETLGRCTIFL